MYVPGTDFRQYLYLLAKNISTSLMVSKVP